MDFSSTCCARTSQPHRFPSVILIADYEAPTQDVTDVGTAVLSTGARLVRVCPHCRSAACNATEIQAYVRRGGGLTRASSFAQVPQHIRDTLAPVLHVITQHDVVLFTWHDRYLQGQEYAWLPQAALLAKPSIIRMLDLGNDTQSTT
jgi:hypothetical protein